jgi:hypothetical protein
MSHQTQIKSFLLCAAQQQCNASTMMAKVVIHVATITYTGQDLRPAPSKVG